MDTATTITDIPSLASNVMDGTDDLDRRTFLKRSAVGSFGFGGLTALDGWNRQDGDDGNGPGYVRRIAFPYPEQLDGDLVRKLFLMTDRKEVDPQTLEDANLDAARSCDFVDWPPDDFNVWEGIIVEWSTPGEALGGFFGVNPDVRAQQLIEQNTVFVEDRESDVPLGTPFIINNVVECPDDYVGVTATQLPGVDIKTGPGVSTGGSPQS